MCSSVMSSSWIPLEVPGWHTICNRHQHAASCHLPDAHLTLISCMPWYKSSCHSATNTSLSVLSMSSCDVYNLQHKCHAYVELRIKVLGISVCYLILSNFLVTCNQDMRTRLILLQERSDCRLTLIQAPVGLTAMFKRMWGNWQLNHTSRVTFTYS